MEAVEIAEMTFADAVLLSHRDGKGQHPAR